MKNIGIMMALMAGLSGSTWAQSVSLGDVASALKIAKENANKDKTVVAAHPATLPAKDDKGSGVFQTYDSSKYSDVYRKPEDAQATGTAVAEKLKSAGYVVMNTTVFVSDYYKAYDCEDGGDWGGCRYGYEYSYKITYKNNSDTRVIQTYNGSQYSDVYRKSEDARATGTTVAEKLKSAGYVVMNTTVFVSDYYKAYDCEDHGDWGGCRYGYEYSYKITYVAKDEASSLAASRIQSADRRLPGARR